KEAARQYLAVEYIRENMPAADSVSSMTAAKASALADTLSTYANKVEIVDIKGRGKKKDTIARVEVAVDGGPPPDGEEVRYLYMEKAPFGGGWRVKGDASALVWHLRLW
ncbi:MAG: hypothetical protein JRI97_00505, partial [Deltaproteobacteria bacterium]|nr:hypothetical protein [Deltaproteobacteria bacterium]